MIFNETHENIRNNYIWTIRRLIEDLSQNEPSSLNYEFISSLKSVLSSVGNTKEYLLASYRGLTRATARVDSKFLWLPTTAAPIAYPPYPPYPLMYTYLPMQQYTPMLPVPPMPFAGHPPIQYPQQQYTTDYDATGKYIVNW